MTIENLDGDKVAVSAEELKRMARDAIAEYDVQIRAGGEPVYPQWAADILKETA